MTLSPLHSPEKPPKRLGTGLKHTLDFAPLLVFFTAYKLCGLFIATAALLATTMVTLAVVYAFERRIALAPLITGVVVAVFGGLTLWLHDETFIKIKPTLINLIFAFILLGGCLAGKGFMRVIAGAAFNLTERGWFLLSRRWGFFFLCLAGLNEVVWRNVPTSVWVNFKVFGLIGLTMIFAVSQVGLLQKYQVEEEKETKDQET